MSILFIDIETVPRSKLLQEWLLEYKPSKPPELKVGNLKDGAKIEAKKLLHDEAMDKYNIKEKDAEKEIIKKMSCDFRMNKIVALEMCDKDGNFCSGSMGESTLLTHFWHTVEKFDLIVGFGISGFDLPSIVQRSSILCIKPSIDLTNLPPYSRTPVYDIQRVLSLTGKPEKGFNLNFWLRNYGIPTKSADGSQVYKWYKEGRFDLISQYSRDDVTATKALFEKIISYYPVPRNYDREKYEN